ncbi:hypothetical protein CBR_g3219 [Chara braunii]|uniref:DUF659 domain-containing protein n=1 Tax=Chara braunii TaxID=69332 RepID=A0A388KF45_CHABU|nr:hypothetical protein CBR_g3219 [Chara braunii]|eukprot:GBG68678.1 hypothetical protein CBR_g3219 [Chara braunii]
MHRDHKLRCNYCKVVYHGNQFKDARHFTQPKRCKQVPMSALADSWNNTDYKFDYRHEPGIRQYMEEQGIVDARSLSQRGTQRRRKSWRRYRKAPKAVADLPREVWFVKLTFKEIGGSGVTSQRDAVATMLAHNRALFKAIGATILTHGRRSRDFKPIIHFLAAGKHGALLYATVCRDGSVPETTEIVLRRWKAIFRSSPPNDVLAICTDSATNYTSAAKLLAKDADPELRRITWLPCSTHVWNLMLSCIGTQVNCIASAILLGRALVQFIKMHDAALHLFRRKRKRRSLVQPVETRFASVFFMLLHLKERRDALESMLHADAWDNIPWESRLVKQAVWVRQTIRDAEFWRDVDYAIIIMTPMDQLLRRLDRGGMVMSLVYSWSRLMVTKLRALQEVQAVPSEIVKDCIDQVLARHQHMFESAHAAAHLVNPRRRSLRYYDTRVRSAEDLEVVQECDNFFLAQTWGDRAGARYLRVPEQMRLFHACIGPLMTDLATRDAEARACIEDDGTPRYAAWWQEHGGSTEAHTPTSMRLQHVCCTCGRPPLLLRGTGRSMSVCARRGVTGWSSQSSLNWLRLPPISNCWTVF